MWHPSMRPRALLRHPAPSRVVAPQYVGTWNAKYRTLTPATPRASAHELLSVIQIVGDNADEAYPQYKRSPPRLFGKASRMWGRGHRRRLLVSALASVVRKISRIRQEAPTAMEIAEKS